MPGGRDQRVRFAVETWAPEYGAPADDTVVSASDAEVDPWVEVDPDDWGPRDPERSAPPRKGALLFVDGVRRVEANVWITDDDGTTHHGLCASYAAGAVRCDGAAQLVAAEVRRGLFSASVEATAIVTTAGAFASHLAGTDEPDALSIKLQRTMARLETDVAAGQPTGAGVTVVDGPLRDGHDRPDMVGYVKTHSRAYGPDVVRTTVMALGVGQRSPLFLVKGVRPRLSWYLRLPVEVRHGWAGVVRLELGADHGVAAAAVVADQLAVDLLRFASVPRKDPRAPQNLYPIGGLERELRRRLGDPALLFRALARAAHGRSV